MFFSKLNFRDKNIFEIKEELKLINEFLIHIEKMSNKKTPDSIIGGQVLIINKKIKKKQ